VSGRGEVSREIATYGASTVDAYPAIQKYKSRYTEARKIKTFSVSAKFRILE
jgi:hypothetical protein